MQSQDRRSEEEEVSRGSAGSLVSSSSGGGGGGGGEGEETLNCYGPMSPTFKVTRKTKGGLRKEFSFLQGLLKNAVSCFRPVTHGFNEERERNGR